MVKLSRPKIPFSSLKETNTEIADLPDGWQRCDGSFIEKGIWAGKRTPDLNGERRFLRGGPDKDVLTLENDQIEDHDHGCSAKSWSDPHQHKLRAFDEGYYMCFCKDDYDSKSRDLTKNVDNWDEYNHYTTSDTVNVHTTCDIGGVTNGAKSGSETRPKNMNVIYIIRIY